MTRLPLYSIDVQKADGPKYKVSAFCAMPGCNRPTDHAHHLWRRSFIGASDWVSVPDGYGHPVTIGNLVGLCWHCHEKVTQNELWIRWVPAELLFTVTRGEETIGELARPPLAPLHEEETPSADPNGETCQACGRPKRKKSEHPPGAKRRRKSWNADVPDDQEDGAVVLDELCEQLAELFEMDDYTSKLKRYYVIVRAFVTVLQHKHLIEV